MKTAFIFPGQGAQAVGMGKDICEAFPAAGRIFDQAQAVTGLPIRRLCFDGPEDEISRTDVAQPAIFTVSAAMLACMREVLGDKMPVADAMAGLSLGEYTALYAAGAMDLETALRLVTRRGAAMQAAATAKPSAMAAILGLDEEKAWQLCKAAAEGEILTCANFNAAGQIVVSGQVGACERAVAKAAEFGASGAQMLKVAGAFHSEIMQPAADELRAALDAATIQPPPVTVVANVSAKPHAGDATAVRTALVRQLTSPVRWQQSMQYLLAGGVEQFYEIGPGRVLAGLMRRIERKAKVACVNSRSAIEELAK